MSKLALESIIHVTYVYRVNYTMLEIKEHFRFLHCEIRHDLLHFCRMIMTSDLFIYLLDSF